MWNKWRARFLATQNSYQTKGHAIARIWELKARDVKKDVLLYFSIWRELTKFNDNKEKKLRACIIRMRGLGKDEAFARWKNYCNELNYTVRMHLLAR